MTFRLWRRRSSAWVSGREVAAPDIGQRDPLEVGTGPLVGFGSGAYPGKRSNCNRLAAPRFRKSLFGWPMRIGEREPDPDRSIHLCPQVFADSKFPGVSLP
jgi:hypothetical protein